MSRDRCSGPRRVAWMEHPLCCMWARRVSCLPPWGGAGCWVKSRLLGWGMSPAAVDGKVADPAAVVRCRMRV